MANLQATGGHDDKINAFVTACTDLGSAQVLANAMAITSLNRDIARTLQVFEFPSTMPDDNLSTDESTRLHPATCELVTEFVPVTAEAN